MESTRELRITRHKRIRRHIFGTPERPRLSVYRSNNNIYVQIIDDSSGRTLVSASTLGKDFSDYTGHRGNVEAAKRIGELIAKKAMAVGLKRVVFDRSGYLYHGSIKALAEAAREAGLEF